MQRSRILLDSGGNAPLTARTTEAVRAGLADGWADPLRLTGESRRSRLLLEGARDAIAAVLSVPAGQVAFAHSPHLAFERLAVGMATARRGSTRILAGATERDALMHAAQHALPHGVETVGVDRLGHIEADAFAAALRSPGVAFAAVQHANQELGTIQRLDALAQVASDTGVPLLVDATASIGHVNPPARWDALVANPADWGGPAGIAVVATRPHTRVLPRWPDGDAYAPGGVNVALALAAAVALQEREEQRAATDARLRALVARLREAVATMPGVDVHGDADERLPHVLTFSCLYVDGESLVGELDKEGFAVGSGSACVTGTLEPSRVLAAIGALTHGNVRLALHPGITAEDVERFVAVLPGVLERIRRQLGAPGIA